MLASLVLVSRLARAESSENLIRMLLGRNHTQSFVYKVNKNGELTYPCGAPVLMTTSLECVLLILTSCPLLVRKE